MECVFGDCFALFFPFVSVFPHSAAFHAIEFVYYLFPKKNRFCIWIDIAVVAALGFCTQNGLPSHSATTNVTTIQNKIAMCICILTHEMDALTKLRQKTKIFNLIVHTWRIDSREYKAAFKEKKSRFVYSRCFRFWIFFSVVCCVNAFVWWTCEREWEWWTAIG